MNRSAPSEKPVQDLPLPETLTKSPYLMITSSNPEIVEVDRKDAVFVGKKTGHAEIRISFSEATSIVQAFVKERKPDRVLLKH